MIKHAAVMRILVLLIAFLLGACASATNDSISSPAASDSSSAVPGEKMPDDQRYGPGPMGSSNVRW